MQVCGVACLSSLSLACMPYVLALRASPLQIEVHICEVVLKHHEAVLPSRPQQEG